MTYGMNQFSATCFFLRKSDYDGRTLESDHTIYFEATTPLEAKRAVWRWVQDRMKNVPDYFAEIGCIKLYTFQPKEIDPMGRLGQATFLPFYEWKYDWPGQDGTGQTEIERLKWETS